MKAATVAVLTLDDYGFAAELGAVLAEAGVRIAEITLRTPNALVALNRMTGIQGLELAAGTVRNPQQVGAAVDAGATWIISPALDEDVIEAARRRRVEPVPGVATATECHRAELLGLTNVKLFPANLLGGAEFVDAIAAPFPLLRFMPSGGINSDNAADYAARPAVFAVASSWMVAPHLVKTRKIDEIARRCRLVVVATAAAGNASAIRT